MLISLNLNQCQKVPLAAHQPFLLESERAVYEVCHAQDMDVRKEEQNAGPGSLGPSGVTLPALRTNRNLWGIPPSIPPICDLSRFSKLYQRVAGQPYPFTEEKTEAQRGGTDHVQYRQV